MTEVVPIVITRFAVRRRAGDVPTEAWVSSRAQLLREIPYASLRAAGVSGLHWLLLTDPAHLDRTRGLAEQLDLPGGQVHVGSAVGLAADTADITLSEPIAPDENEFLTFRLDSDDALGPQAIEGALRLAANASDGCLVDLAVGYRLDRPTGEMRTVVHPVGRQGPFLAIRHWGRDRMLDTGGPHPAARTGREVRRWEEPGWVQVVHGGNLRNAMTRPTVTGRVRALRAIVRRQPGTVDGRAVRPADVAEVLDGFGLDTGPR